MPKQNTVVSKTQPLPLTFAKLSIWTMLIAVVGIPSVSNADEWTINSQAEWKQNAEAMTGLDIKKGMAEPNAKTATFKSVVKRYDAPRQAGSISIGQSAVWENWQPTKKEIGPTNLGDAPVMLQLGPKNYWMFGRYRQANAKQKDSFVSEDAKLEGFDVPTAEFVDGKAYFYYDFPNDQDPHLYIDSDLTDGVPGKSMGLAFKDPSDGSDCAIIRDLSGKFHLILEDWSPINASTHAWDSPLAMHAVSDDGIGDFKILAPPVDERTKATGKFKEYFHPHWHKEDPKNFPAKVAGKDVPQHKIKAGNKRASAKYEVHKPEQNAFGDWAAISIGGQNYLFCDYDPAGGHGSNSMSVAWFTASSIDGPFAFCGNIGKGHPDPDVMFAEGKFYLATQTQTDYVSPGPWVESVEARVGVDVDNDGSIDQWTDWQAAKESYDYIDGFAKQVAKTPAELDLSSLPKGYGFQFEMKITDTTENASKPILDNVTLSFK